MKKTFWVFVLVFIGGLSGHSAVAGLNQTQVSQLYVSIFGRASEGEGNAYWISRNLDMTTTAMQMLGSPAAIEYFGGALDSDQAFVEHIYANTLGKTLQEDPEGISFWVNKLTLGRSRASIVAEIVYALAYGDFSGDADAIAAQNQFNNRVEVSNYTADHIQTCPDLNDLSDFKHFISAVTDNPASVAIVMETIDAFGTQTTKANWTYMVYIAGDNNLSSAALGDINEMETIGSSDKVNVVVQVEFSPEYTQGLPNYNTLRGKILKDNDPLMTSPLEDIGNKDMGDKQTLKAFIQWAAAQYPAEHYALVLWDHGDGWKGSRHFSGGSRGALQDLTSDSFMSLPDLAGAVADSGVYFDLINFDACLMAMYEVIYEFNGLTDYMVFSEEIEPGEGDPYNKILEALIANPGMTPAALAGIITSKFKAFYQSQQRTGVTKSAVDMAHTGSLHTNIRQLVQLMNDYMATDRPNIQAARDESISFDSPENHDLGHFLEKLADKSLNVVLKTKISQVRSVLSTLVINNDVYSPDPQALMLKSSGLSIFLPRRDQVTDADLSNYQLLAVNQARSEDTHSWGNFVNLLVSGDASDGMGPMVTAPGNFVIWLEWDSDADLDLLIWEPDGNWAAPYIGSSSPNGFLSEDSFYSGASAEYYQAAEIVEAGEYDIFVNYYEDGTTLGTTAYVYILDPEHGITEYELSGQRWMGLTYPAPLDWFDDFNEWDNVWNDMYSDWWWPGDLTCSAGKRAGRSLKNNTVIIGNKRVHFVPIPDKKKYKGKPRLDGKTTKAIKAYFNNRLN